MTKAPRHDSGSSDLEGSLDFMDKLVSLPRLAGPLRVKGKFLIASHTSIPVSLKPKKKNPICQCWKKCVSLMLLLFNCSVMSSSFMTPWTLACQAPLSTGSLRQESWSGFYFLLQGIFPTSASNLRPLHWQVDSLPLSHQGSPVILLLMCKSGDVIKPSLLVPLSKHLGTCSV